MFWAGVAVSLVAVVFFAVAKLVDGLELHPSPELLRTMSGIGASFFLAFVIEATWMASRPEMTKGDEASSSGAWTMGFFSGLAAAGLTAVVIALILSEKGRTDWTAWEEFWFSWSIVALALLGVMVAIQPILTHGWESSSSSGDSADGD